jgi:hypothetical protein
MKTADRSCFSQPRDASVVRRFLIGEWQAEAHALEPLPAETVTGLDVLRPAILDNAFKGEV